MWVTYADDNPCMMKALLEAGGNINLTDREGRTILMEAVRSNATRIARMLVAAGADVNARSSRNETALSIARSEHNEAMVSLLKRAGAGD
jgi:ankyrin repeat protein